MQSTKVYIKKNKRYIDIGVKAEDIEILRYGTHIVSVEKNGRYIKYCIEPKSNLELLATFIVKRNAIMKALEDALAMRPINRTLTPKQKKAWVAFQEAMGEDRYIVAYNSIADIFDAIVTEATKEFKGDQS